MKYRIKDSTSLNELEKFGYFQDCNKQVEELRWNE